MPARADVANRTGLWDRAIQSPDWSLNRLGAGPPAQRSTTEPHPASVHRLLLMHPATTSRPWFHEGLAFECTQCGNCCTGTPGYVWVDDSEITAIAGFLDKPVGEIRLLHTRLARGQVSLTDFANGDCTFFDPQTRRCTIYPVRPRQCRTWPFWRSNIATPEDWERTCQICPGAGRGNLVTVAEIENRAAQIEL